MKFLDDGTASGNEFCRSFNTFKLAKSCMEHAQKIVQRSAQDQLSDGEFLHAVDMMKNASPDSLTMSVDLDDAIGWLRVVPTAGQKVLTAWTEWSQSRREERWESVSSLIDSFASVADHAAALATTTALCELIPMMQKVVIRNPDAGVEAGVPQDLAEEIDALSESAWGMRACLLPLWEELQTVASYLENLVSALLRVSRGTTAIADTAAEMKEALTTSKSWFSMLMSWLVGVESMAPILMRAASAFDDSTKYPLHLELYEEHKRTGNNGVVSCLHDSDQRKAACQIMPLLTSITALYAAQRRVREELEFPAETFKRVCGALPEKAEVDMAIDWIEESPLAKWLHNKIWVPLRSSLFDGLLNELMVNSASTTDEATVQGGNIDGKFLSLLIGADLGGMANKALHLLDLADHSMGKGKVNIFPHIQHIMSFQQVLAETSRGAVFASSWQHTPSQADELPDDKGGLCSTVLQTFGAMHSVMMMSAAAQHFVFGPGATDAFAPPPGPGPQRAGASGQQQGAVNLDAMNALTNLKSMLDKFDFDLASKDLEEVENKHRCYNLVRPISFLKVWSRQIRSFLAGCQARMFSEAGRRLQGWTEELESCVPRWSSVFASRQDIDWAMVTARITQAPKRGHIAPLVRHVKGCVATMSNFQKMWGCDLGIDNNIIGFVREASDTAENFLLVVAAVNTVTTQTNSANFSKQCQEVLDISAKRPTCDMPPALKIALQTGAVGKAQTVVQTGLKRNSASITKDEDTVAAPTTLEPPPTRRSVAASSSSDPSGGLSGAASAPSEGANRLQASPPRPRRC